MRDDMYLSFTLLAMRPLSTQSTHLSTECGKHLYRLKRNPRLHTTCCACAARCTLTRSLPRASDSDRTRYKTSLRSTSIGSGCSTCWSHRYSEYVGYRGVDMSHAGYTCSPAASAGWPRQSQL
jgi:hypothetical protein